MSAFAEYLYSILVAPRRTVALLGERDITIGLGLFALGAVSFALSLAVIMRLPMHPVAAIIALLSAVCLLFVSTAIRTALVSMVSIAGLKYRRGKSLRTFFTASLSLNALFSYLLPAAFIFAVVGAGFFMIVYIAAAVAVLVCMIRVIEEHFTFRSWVTAGLSALIPVGIDAVVMFAAVMLMTMLGGSMIPRP